MKQCIKCRQQIEDSCDVCPYCGQWQAQIKETENVKTTKACVKCRQQISLDCEECTYCGQIQPVEKIDNEINADDVKQADKKKQWKIALVVFGVGVLLLVGIRGIIIWSSQTPTPVSTTSYTYATQATTEPNIELYESIVEESDNDMGGRIIYDYTQFWKKYEENLKTSGDTMTDKEVEDSVKTLSDLSYYEINSGNQAQTNKAVTIYSPTTDWILSDFSTTIGKESDSGKIISVMTIIQGDLSKVHSAFCASVMCNIPYVDAFTLIEESVDKLIDNENALCVYNNIIFTYGTSGDNLTLTLFAASDKVIETVGKEKDVIYLDANINNESSEEDPYLEKLKRAGVPIIEKTGRIDLWQYESSDKYIESKWISDNDYYISEFTDHLSLEKVSIDAIDGDTLDIPELGYKGKPITVISGYLEIVGNETPNIVKNVIIPDSVILIEENAFSGFNEFENLESVYLSDSVYQINDAAFYTGYCGTEGDPNTMTFFTNNKLKSVRMSQNIHFIDGDNFYTESIYLPKSLKRLNCLSVYASEINYEGSEDDWNNLDYHYDYEQREYVNEDIYNPLYDYKKYLEYTGVKINYNCTQEE